jgi:hypothetical protein
MNLLFGRIDVQSMAPLLESVEIYYSFLMGQHVVCVLFDLDLCLHEKMVGDPAS